MKILATIALAIGLAGTASPVGAETPKPVHVATHEASWAIATADWDPETHDWHVQVINFQGGCVWLTPILPWGAWMPPVAHVCGWLQLIDYHTPADRSGDIVGWDISSPRHYSTLGVGK